MVLVKFNCVLQRISNMKNRNRLQGLFVGVLLSIVCYIFWAQVISWFRETVLLRSWVELATYWWRGVRGMEEQVSGSWAVIFTLIWAAVSHILVLGTPTPRKIAERLILALDFILVFVVPIVIGARERGQTEVLWNPVAIVITEVVVLFILTKFWATRTFRRASPSIGV